MKNFRSLLALGALALETDQPLREELHQPEVIVMGPTETDRPQVVNGIQQVLLKAIQETQDSCKARLVSENVGDLHTIPIKIQLTEGQPTQARIETKNSAEALWFAFDSTEVAQRDCAQKAFAGYTKDFRANGFNFDCTGNLDLHIGSIKIAGGKTEQQDIKAWPKIVCEYKPSTQNF